MRKTENFGWALNATQHEFAKVAGSQPFSTFRAAAGMWPRAETPKALVKRNENGRKKNRRAAARRVVRSFALG
jgi:hypothetical protein